MTDTVSLTINLPIKGTREDYLHCVSSALMDAIRRGDTDSANAVAGLFTLVEEAQSNRATPKPCDVAPASHEKERVRAPFSDHP